MIGFMHCDPGSPTLLMELAARTRKPGGTGCWKERRARQRARRQQDLLRNLPQPDSDPEFLFADQGLHGLQQGRTRFRTTWRRRRQVQQLLGAQAEQPLEPSLRSVESQGKWHKGE